MAVLNVRFGILVGRTRARCWRVRSGARRPEVFIEREGLERAVHLSLHESGDWHMKVAGKKAREWSRPEEFHAGYTRAAVIVQPPAIAALATAAPPNAVMVALEERSDDAAQFNVFLERPGANPGTWPGMRSMGTELIARLPLAGESGTVCVVVHRAAIAGGTRTAPRPSDEAIALMTEAAKEGSLYATLIGFEPDGAVSLIDVRHGAPNTA